MHPCHILVNSVYSRVGFVRENQNRPFHRFFNFLNYMDQVGKIRRHQLKSEISKFKSDTTLAKKI